MDKETLQILHFELHKKRMQKKGFEGFCNAYGYELARHHKLIAEKLEKLIVTPNYNLMICMQPGSAKSRYASILFPSYLLGKQPGTSIIAACNTAELASKWGRACKRLISQPIYEYMFHETLNKDSHSSDRFDLTNGSEYLASGVGGTITGNRMDCLPGDTNILTNYGEIRIDNIEIGIKPYYILSYEEQKHRTEYRRIVALSKRPSIERFRIRTANGYMVEATGNHRIRVGDGWKETSSIVVGDILMCLLQNTSAQGELRAFKENKKEQQVCVFLQHFVLHTIEQCEKRYGRSKNLQQLLETSPRIVQGEENLFKRMSFDNKNSRVQEESDNQGAPLSDMWCHLQACEQCHEFKILFDAMQEQWACEGYVVEEQSFLEAWKESFQISRRKWSQIPTSQEGSFNSRHEVMCGVQGNEESASTSCGHGSNQQCIDQYCYPLCTLSLEASRCGEGKTIADTVVMVERICEPTTVYDIEVEDNHNFFANGILVHNCGIIDDPIRSREDADSERVRDKIWDWYVNDFCTRVKPGARKIIINTRWHEDDLSGRILMSNDRENWDVLSLPAIAEPGDLLGREPGEVLWPEYITQEMVYQTKAITDTRTWNSLYQQRPAADEGSYFKSEWLQFVDVIPKGLKIYGASDYAVSADRGDYTVHIVIGHDDVKDEIYVIDMWRQQTESNVWIENFINLCLKHEPLMWGEEQGQIIKSLNPFIEKEMIRRRCFTFRQQFTSTHDKTVRARSIQAYMAQKRVFILNKAWTDDFIHEILKFPAGKFDDAVDAFGLIGRMLDEMMMRVEKVNKKDDYGYKSGRIMLPGLDSLKKQKKSEFKRF